MVQARGYTRMLVQKEISKVELSGNWNQIQTKKMSKGIPLVVTFNHLLKDFVNIIHKNLYLLYMD